MIAEPRTRIETFTFEEVFCPCCEEETPELQVDIEIRPEPSSPFFEPTVEVSLLRAECFICGSEVDDRRFHNDLIDLCD